MSTRSSQGPNVRNCLTDEVGPITTAGHQRGVRILVPRGFESPIEVMVNRKKGLRVSGGLLFQDEAGVDLCDAAGDAHAVQLLKGDGLLDEEIECALQEFGGRDGHGGSNCRS